MYPTVSITLCVYPLPTRYHSVSISSVCIPLHICLTLGVSLRMFAPLLYLTSSVSHSVRIPIRVYPTLCVSHSVCTPYRKSPNLNSTPRVSCSVCPTPCVFHRMSPTLCSTHISHSSYGSYIPICVCFLCPTPCVSPISHSAFVTYIPIRVCFLYLTPCVSAISHVICVSHIPLRVCLLYPTLCGSLRVFYSYISLCMCPRCGSHFVCVLLSYPYAIPFVCSTPYVFHPLCVPLHVPPLVCSTPRMSHSWCVPLRMSVELIPFGSSA